MTNKRNRIAGLISYPLRGRGSSLLLGRVSSFVMIDSVGTYAAKQIFSEPILSEAAYRGKGKIRERSGKWSTLENNRPYGGSVASQTVPSLD
jgi:hypothetical protein